MERVKAGIALYLDQISEYLAYDCPLSAEERIAEIEQKPQYKQNDLMRKIREALVYLLSPERKLDSVIPAAVRALAESQIIPEPNQLTPLFDWVARLHREIQTDKTRDEQSTAAVAYRLGGDATEFLRYFSRLSFQTISLWNVENSCALALPDTGWGKVELHFEDLVSVHFPEMPILAELFRMVAELNDDGTFTFRFLVYLQSKNARHQLLTHDAWKEFSVTCRSAQVVLMKRNYEEYYRLRGSAGGALLRACCYALLNKLAILGPTHLTPGESELTDVAYLLARLDNIPVPEPSIYPENQSDLLLDNRYLCYRAIQFLRKYVGDIGMAMAALLEAALLTFEDGQFKTSDHNIRRLCKFLYDGRFNGQLSALYVVTEEMFADACKDYTDADLFDVGFRSLREALCHELEPILQQNHFTGTFPNYHRLTPGRNAVELLSFRTETIPHLSPNGLIDFRLSLSVARCSLLPGVDNLPKAGFYPPDKISANSLESETAGLKRATIVALPNGVAPHFRVFSNALPEAISLFNGTQTLQEFLKIAFAAFSGTPLPENYCTYTKEFARETRLFRQCFKRSLVFGVFAMIFALFWGREYVVESDVALFVLLLSSALGLAVSLVLSICLYFYHRSSFWEI